MEHRLLLPPWRNIRPCALDLALLSPGQWEEVLITQAPADHLKGHLPWGWLWNGVSPWGLPSPTTSPLKWEARSRLQCDSSLFSKYLYTPQAVGVGSSPKRWGKSTPNKCICQRPQHSSHHIPQTWGRTSLHCCPGSAQQVGPSGQWLFTWRSV